MHRVSFQKNTREEAGFTLIEVMVAVSIFTIAILIGIGSLFSITKSLRQSQGEREALDSLSFALETMTRQIRVGKDYTCTGGGSPCEEFTFTWKDPYGLPNDPAIDITYRIRNDGDIKRLEVETSDEGASFLTPTTVNIESFSVELFEASQPLAHIRIKGKTKAGPTREYPFFVQTSVSQRLIVNQ